MRQHLLHVPTIERTLHELRVGQPVMLDHEVIIDGLSGSTRARCPHYGTVSARVGAIVRVTLDLPDERAQFGDITFPTNHNPNRTSIAGVWHLAAVIDETALP